MPDQELRHLYADLLASEARHFGLYWLLAIERHPREAVEARLKELSVAEVEALTGVLDKPEDVRFHSYGVKC